MEIDIKELFNNEQFVYALADSLAEKMFCNKVYEQFFDDWNAEFAKMLKENIDKKVENEVNEYVSSFDINKTFSNVLYTKLSNIIDEIKKTQDTLDICF